MMKTRRALLATLSVGALVAVPAVTVTTAGAGVATATVTVAQMATYSAGNNFPLTVCIDGDILAEDVASGTLVEPTIVAAGIHDIVFVQGDDCNDESPFIEGSFEASAGADITVMSYWGEGRGIGVFDNDPTCVPVGTSRVTVRNAAPPTVDYVLTPDGGEPTALVSDLATGEQGVGEPPAGHYTDRRFVDAGTTDTVVAFGPTDLESGEDGVLYLYGGADGSSGYGYYAGENPCDPTTPTTPTTAAPATTTTTSAAQVIAETTPRFAG